MDDITYEQKLIDAIFKNETLIENKKILRKCDLINFIINGKQLEYIEYSVLDRDEEINTWVRCENTLTIKNKIIKKPFYIIYHNNIKFENCIISKNAIENIPRLYNNDFLHNNKLKMNVINCEVINE